MTIKLSWFLDVSFFRPSSLKVTLPGSWAAATPTSWPAIPCTLAPAPAHAPDFAPSPAPAHSPAPDHTLSSATLPAPNPYQELKPVPVPAVLQINGDFRIMIGIQEDVLNMFLITHFLLLFTNLALVFFFTVLVCVRNNPSFKSSFSSDAVSWWTTRYNARYRRCRAMLLLFTLLKKHVCQALVTLYKSFKCR